MTTLHITGKKLLITGGTGSFGRAFLERVLDEDLAEARVFSRDELKQHELRDELQDPRVKFYIGDVRDRDGVANAVEGVDLVFHAAALKQVPSCEFFPMEAVATNVVGSKNVIRAAVRAGVGKVVCLSTDKAVYPINAMGMTKGLMEKTVQAEARAAGPDRTVLCVVRYGNVMFSRGSVLPLFVRQILEGGPITLTGREMTRFLLPLWEALDLVEFAMGHARQGDLFVRKAPATSNGVIVEALQTALGRITQVQTIGIRHGEKLHETLLTREELGKAEDLGAYYRVPPDERDLNYKKYFDQGSLTESDIQDYTSDGAEQLTLSQAVELLERFPEIGEARRYLETSGSA